MPEAGGGFGLGADALSALCMYAPDFLNPAPDAEAQHMFPDGNATLARLLTRTLLPDAIDGDQTPEGVHARPRRFLRADRPGSPTRIRLRSTVVWVQHDGDPRKAPSRDDRLHEGRPLFRIRARSVVMAGG